MAEDLVSMGRAVAFSHEAESLRAEGSGRVTTAAWHETTANTIDQLIAEIERLRARETELAMENDRLRAAIANSDSPCIYCSLPKEEWIKCQYGFPGCGRADDAMGCPELGASLENKDLRALNERFVWSLTGDEVPEIWRIEWLRSLLDAFAEGKAIIQDDEDPAATIQALAECRALVDDATAALTAARQEPSHG